MQVQPQWQWPLATNRTQTQTSKVPVRTLISIALCSTGFPVLLTDPILEGSWPQMTSLDTKKKLVLCIHSGLDCRVPRVMGQQCPNATLRELYHLFSENTHHVQRAASSSFARGSLNLASETEEWGRAKRETDSAQLD